MIIGKTFAIYKLGKVTMIHKVSLLVVHFFSAIVDKKQVQQK